MAELRVMSWNIRGARAPRKRTMVFAHIRRLRPHVIALQETHLTPERVHQFTKPWIQWSQHSCHTSFSRGVSLLITRTVRWDPVTVRRDSRGCYIFVYAFINNVPYVLLFIYNPPPASMEVLHSAVTFAAGYPSARVLCMGDFNMVPNMALDRHSTRGVPSGGDTTPLSLLVDEVGWLDVYRTRHPHVRQYSCHTLGRNALSRIDLAYGNALLVAQVSAVSYEPRAISDHSPLLLDIRMADSGAPRRWKIHPFWLDQIGPNDRVPDQLQVFLQANAPGGSPVLVWETLKAYLRGCLRSTISYIKRSASRREEELAGSCAALEARYVADPSEANKVAWLREGRQYMLHLHEKANRKLFFTKQFYFEHGNQSSKLLAHVVRQNSSTAQVLKIRAPDGSVLMGVEEMAQCFSAFYANLYSSQVQYDVAELASYLDGIEFPALSDSDREMLDAPFTLLEVQDAVAAMTKGKSPGPDGLPLEVYLRYSEDLLPPLLAMFDRALADDVLPDSVYEATIVVLLKPDKDPLECGSYRPISLLNLDYKILTKILANRLNRVVLSIVHPDQTGFMPGKSTSDNIRRVQTAVQVGGALGRDWALASLDAAKAFDSVEWGYLQAVLSRFGFGPVFRRWVSLLYRCPRAQVLVNGICSRPFSLGRGTRQGCPLSPLLFAVAVEPLALRIRQDPGFRGMLMGDKEERIGLYADDTVLFLSDPLSMLPHTMALMDRFGYFSGLCINWSKSVVMPLLDKDWPPVMSGLPVVTEFKYLGVLVHRDPARDLESNILSLLPYVRSKFRVWATLPLSVTGRINLVKGLFVAGKIPGTRVAELKAKYTLLYETLKSIQESEIQLLQNAKHFTNLLEKQQHELQKADEFPEGSNSEVSRMRQQLLKYNNDLNEAEEREYQLQYKLECLREEKRLLEREYERIPKSGELEKRAKLLKETSDELHKENTQRILEIKALKEDLALKEKEIQKEQTELEKIQEQQEIIKDELVRVQYIPEQIGKDIEKIQRKAIETEKKKLKLEAECQEFNHNIKQIENKTKKMLEEKEDVMKELEGKRTLLDNKEQECNHLTKLLEFSKENEAVALGERATLDLNLRHAMIEKQTQHDALTRKQKEKDWDMRNIKKLELQLKSANDGFIHTQSFYDKIKAEIDIFPKDDGLLIEKRKELRKEVDTLKRQFAQQQALTEVEAHILAQCLAEEEQLVKEQGDCREELVNLTRLVQIKADEREQKSRDFVKAKQRYQQVLQEIKGRDLIIGEHKKKNQEVQRRLQEFAKMYDIIRNERNKCVSLIQMATQRAAELREKLKIYGNEMEILRTNVSSKERQLQKAMLKQTNNHMIRDSLQKDVSRASLHLQEVKEKREQQKMEIGRLTNMINQAEEEMVGLRKKYESAVKNRNERGVQLIEREEEVCIFYEKINTQEMLLRSGDVEMMALDEKIRFLKMQVTEKTRQIEQIKKELPNKKALESDLITLQIQLSQCNDKVAEFENLVQSPDKESRIRILDGKDPAVEDLMKKMEELELRLAEKEEHLLEKDFLYEQVSRLSERIRIKVENGKEDTLILAKKMNELQKKIKDTTRKMMSRIAELSMQQASYIKLQQEVRDKEKFVQKCYTKMEQGLPPSEETEQEWKRLLREERRRRLEKEEKARAEEEEEHYMLPNGIYTTAEQRPNAYIPEDENALPLPRPYGALAPFKPSEPCSNMRHIRKPLIKPIEI